MVVVGRDRDHCIGCLRRWGDGQRPVAPVTTASGLGVSGEDLRRCVGHPPRSPTLQWHGRRQPRAAPWPGP